MTHRARPPDGLYASALNLSDGGKNVKPMRDGWYWAKDADGNDVRVTQRMQNDKGVQKGMRTILMERGNKHLGFGGHELKKICRFCINQQREDNAGTAAVGTSCPKNLIFWSRSRGCKRRRKNTGFISCSIPSITASSTGLRWYGVSSNRITDDSASTTSRHWMVQTD